ncbi:hypothetical protein CASFOL_025945 [Castilleja foliolosa]|uniref:Peptidyl-prolyl cis-trans isomerase n=1 Tax=Castilleja foliolosa TaxID=1961234 RepID=A0ABD3CSJ3_9LAMI
MHCSSRLLHRYNLTPPPKPLFPVTSLSSPPNNPISSRRQFTSSSSLLLLLTTTPPDPLKAIAETINTKHEYPNAFLDISINGEPVGRIIITLYTDTVPFGAARFSELVTGAAGVSYRRKSFVKIMPNYVQHGGLISYSSNNNSALISEWEKQEKQQNGTCRNVAKSVSILVRDPSKPPPGTKLVARKGKLEMIDEEVMGPNGTEFVIVTRDSPELDESGLVVGTVVEGMDVVERIAEIKTVQDNSSSNYFKVAKLIGDKRAVVAERGFNRPYSKVVVTNCGLIMG